MYIVQCTYSTHYTMYHVHMHMHISTFWFLDLYYSSFFVLEGIVLLLVSHRKLHTEKIRNLNIIDPFLKKKKKKNLILHLQEQ